ncbi:MAG: leucine-rich repeat domain-containing protein, partial [Ruminococcus sp.]|nr:leucine-rich repeat domain-containing protein [Ruminococcus sp.]
MLKKLIASTLSATFLCSSIMLDRIIDTPIVRDLPLADGTQSLSNNESNDKAISNGQYDLKATNSLGSYITNMAADHNSNNSVAAAPLSTDGRFEVSSLEYDNVTGDISICSSQTSACNVEVSFFNDETGELSFKVSQPVEAGDYVKTNAKADLSKLPQFYKINAQLVDKMGNPISNVFHENKYTQKIQEIIATDIHDFEPEQVVNLDESEQTNFLVLNEKTIKAESSETENTLVSADYENNVFVFDNVDDTLQNLQDGDLFYIQPTEKDIIAISVDDISIDDGKATVSGSPDIEEMFDAIKIDSSVAKEIEYDTTNADSSITFPDHPNENKFTYENGKPLNFQINRKKLFELDYSSDDSDEFTLFNNLYDIIKPTIGKEWETSSENVKTKIDGDCSLVIEHHFSCYYFWNTLEIEFTITPNFTLNLFLGIDIENDSDTLGEFLSKRSNEFKANLCAISIVTEIPGILISMEPKLKFEFSGGIKVEIKYAPTIGFSYDNDDGFEPINDISENEDGEEQKHCDVKIAGELFFGVELNPGFCLFDDDIAKAGLKIDIGIKVEYEAKNDTTPNIKKSYSSSKRVMKPNINVIEDSIHDCFSCFEGSAKFVVTIEFDIEILGHGINTGVKLEIETDPFWEFHFSLNPFSLGKGKECDNYKYKAKFKTYDDDTSAPIMGLTVTIENISINTNSQGDAKLFCDNGKYNYTIKDGDKVVKTGSFIIDDSQTNINLGFKVNIDSEGKRNLTYSVENSLQGPKRPTTTQTTTIKTTTTTTTVKHPEHQIIQSIKLGDSIGGLVYPNGYVYIYGSGEMYDFDGGTPFKNIKDIKIVYFDSVDSEHGKYITSIGNHVFDGAENLDVVYLSNQIKRIGDFAFKDCKNLKWFRYGGFTDETETFNLPTELIKIGDNAFKNCQNIKFTTEELPGSLEYIGNEAFFSCGKIESIIVPDNVTTIGTEAFCNCTSLKKAVIGKGVTSIGAQSFKNCIALEDLTLPFAGLDSNLSAPAIKLFSRGKDGYKETYNSRYSDGIEYYVPESLKSITITGGETIPDNAFYGMSSLTSVTIPDNVTEIGENAFYNCSKLETFKLPSKLINIKNYAFKNCQNIIFTTEKLPGSLKYIGNEAFFSCGKIESIIVPDNVTTIGTEAFCNCTSLKKAV